MAAKSYSSDELTTVKQGGHSPPPVEKRGYNPPPVGQVRA